MSGDLDSILNDDKQPVQEIETPEVPETPTEPEATPEPVAEEPKGPVRDEKGRFAPKGETESASPAPETAEPPLDHAAVLGERRRRQEAEARIRELEQRMAQFQQPTYQPTAHPAPQAAPSFEFNEDLYWSNPQAFLDGFAQNIRQSVMQEVQGIIPQMVTGVSIDRAEQAARARYEDYDQAIAAFREVALVTPSVREKMAVQADPAEFAYQEGKRLLEMSNYGSTNEYIEAEVARRLAATQQVEPKPAPIIPVSLADAPAAGASASSASAPLSLDAVLGRRG